jgi:hypothetical protein
MVAAIKGQAVIIAVQLEFLLPKPLFIGTKIDKRTSLSGAKRVERERYSQNQKKASAHVSSPDSEREIVCGF